ncbi:uncharacterized protein HD556DRAFT_1450057 [Suillus plorans]|uniref:DUF6533 domain-containing protein n=1 Tax=Suillus plorans TaxID=116603 RepID=A0A9P7ABV3_9AGAM|nr:uncharacterized protein HD556DRAFT_1450057 [Suillus plorans]KAG1786071.1 hypothetical protein HD556DRAFT_1450057 [Suillus plorans]
MTIVSNDPTLWPFINAYRCSSYFGVAAFVVMSYDWALTFGQEVELIWRQRWSLMTVMYLSVRYLGILVAVLDILIGIPTILLTDTTSGEELVLSGTYQCTIGYTGDTPVLDSVLWIIFIVWEVLTLCLAVWIGVKHFRELRLHSAGEIIGDFFMVLMKTHVVYFANFVAVSCFELIIEFSPTSSTILEDQTLSGSFEILMVVQMFVLGPRLILGIREYNAELVADSDAATGMTSIAFQDPLVRLTMYGAQRRPSGAPENQPMNDTNSNPYQFGSPGHDSNPSPYQFPPLLTPGTPLSNAGGHVLPQVDDFFSRPPQAGEAAKPPAQEY